MFKGTSKTWNFKISDGKGKNEQYLIKDGILIIYKASSQMCLIPLAWIFEKKKKKQTSHLDENK